ncbi:MAG: NHL repeat-containing protein, partial [Myxococcota bacterium]
MKLSCVVICSIGLITSSALAKNKNQRNPGVELKQTFGIEPPDLFNSPTGVADDNNNLYIAETAGSVIRKFDPAGNLVQVIGSRGNKRGELNAPVEIEVFDDVLYISELGGLRISRFTVDGHFIDTIGEGELVGPRAVTLDENGTIYALDEFSNRIVFFDQDGTKLSECSPLGFFIPNDIFFSDGALFVANANAQNLLKLDLDCNVLAVTGTPGAGLGQFNFPRSIFVRDGLVYVSDALNNRVQIFDTDLNFVDVFGGFPVLLNPNSTLIREDGTVVVVETGRHQVKFFSPDDLVTPIQVLGDPRTNPGVLNAPGGIFFDEDADELYVADTNNGRIQVFDFHSGEFKRTFGTPGFG